MNNLDDFFTKYQVNWRATQRIKQLTKTSLAAHKTHLELEAQIEEEKKKLI